MPLRGSFICLQGHAKFRDPTPSLRCPLTTLTWKPPAHIIRADLILDGQAVLLKTGLFVICFSRNFDMLVGSGSGSLCETQHWCTQWRQGVRSIYQFHACLLIFWLFFIHFSWNTDMLVEFWPGSLCHFHHYSVLNGGGVFINFMHFLS